MIALVAVGQATATLARTERRAIYDLEKATFFVAERLPVPLTAKLSYDDVELVLRWHLTYLRERGLASFGRVDLAAEVAANRRRLVVTDDDEAIDAVLARAAEAGVDIDAVDVVAILDLEYQYLVSIGAVGEMIEELPSLDAGEAHYFGELEPPAAPPDEEP
ncbi:MAG: hypothetical protein KDB21_05125 [Acidimicrobiales bacterium]|nr:hypothetical protein [Acidimicrobiales bacterium]